MGVQFQTSGEYVYVPVLVNSGSDKLTSFQIVVQFDDALLLAAGRVKIADFGSARLLQHGATLEESVSTCCRMSRRS